MQRDDFLWVEKYRPTKISDCVLPSDLSEPFSEFVEQGKVPNLILTGGPCLLYTSPSPRDVEESRMPSSA